IHDTLTNYINTLALSRLNNFYHGRSDEPGQLLFTCPETLGLHYGVFGFLPEPARSEHVSFVHEKDKSGRVPGEVEACGSYSDLVMFEFSVLDNSEALVEGGHELPYY